MTIPSTPQTFALEDSRDVLEKLGWEVEGFRKTSPHDPQELSFRAFNVAVTAWHMVDWVWSDMTATQKSSVPVSSLSGFKKYVRTACRPVYLCREIANASKHRLVTQGSDNTIDANVSILDNEDFRIEGPVLSWNLPVYKLAFVDGAKFIPAEKIFDQALQYWTSFIDGRKIAL